MINLHDWVLYMTNNYSVPLMYSKMLLDNLGVPLTVLPWTPWLVGKFYNPSSNRTNHEQVVGGCWLHPILTIIQPLYL